MKQNRAKVIFHFACIRLSVTFFLFQLDGKIAKQIIHAVCEDADEGGYDSAKHPVLVVNALNSILLIVADPNIAQDLYTTKNMFYDKTGSFEAIFSNLLGRSFLFSEADEHWKAKRKACAHAFYKSRLVNMLETLKDKIEASINEWKA